MKLRCLISTIAVILPLAAIGQVWPTKPVKLIVTLPAGTPPDVLARGLARQLESRLGQPVVVENRAGANNIIGMQACAGAVSDGYTLCVSTNDSVSVNPHLYQRLPYDPDKQIKPVAILAWPNSVIVVDSRLPAKSFQEVVELSKSRPGTMYWGSFGNGSSSHLYLEWIRSKIGWDVTHVPFQGSPIQPMLAGQVQLTYFAIGALKPHIDSGKMRPIAVAGYKRSLFLPDVPTFEEVGLGKFFVRTWFGLFAPSGTPDKILEQLNVHATAIVNDAEFRAKVLDPLTLTPGNDDLAGVTAYMKTDREFARDLVRAANVKLDQ